MRSNGSYVLCFFAAAWGVLAFSLLSEPLWLRLAPAALSLLLAGLTALLTRHDVPSSDAWRKHVGRAVALWSTVEGIAIVGAVNILANIGHREWTFAAVAIIVGLHFYPLAMSLRVPLYAVTGTVMIAAAGTVLYLLPSGVMADSTIALASAVTLWLTVLIIMASGDRRRKEALA